MEIKNKFFIISLVFFVLISISFVSASDNVTDTISTDNPDELAIDEIYDNDNYEILNDSDNPVKAKIYAKDFSTVYDSDKPLHIQIKDENGNALENINVNVVYSNGYEDFAIEDFDGKYEIYVGENVGNYKATISIDDDNYFAEPINVNVKITKAPIKVGVKQITATKNKYFVLKAVITDKYGLEVDQGTVKFNINGKIYKVNVKNGIASKKLKLSNVKTYNVKATFSSKNYNTKTVSSKIIVKKPKITKTVSSKNNVKKSKTTKTVSSKNTVKSKKYHYFKKGKYSFKVTESQYKRIQYVKNHKHDNYLSRYADFKVKTGHYHKGHRVHAVVTTWAGSRKGVSLYYPQVQFVVMYGKNTWEWDFLTAHYRL